MQTQIARLGPTVSTRDTRIGKASTTFPIVTGNRGANGVVHASNLVTYTLKEGHCWLQCTSCHKWRDISEEKAVNKPQTCFSMGIRHNTGHPCRRACVRCNRCNCNCATQPKKVLVEDRMRNNTLHENQRGNECDGDGIDIGSFVPFTKIPTSTRTSSKRKLFQSDLSSQPKQRKPNEVDE